MNAFFHRAHHPNQAFSFKLRDTNETERGVIINVDQEGQWTQCCIDLDKSSTPGVKLDRLENLNIVFEESTGSTTAWVDDFEFK